MILKKRLKHIYGWSYLRAIIKNLTAAIIMGIVAYLSYFGLISLVPALGARTMTKLLVLLFTVFVSVITYGGISYLFGVGEVKMGIEMIKGRLKKA